MFRYKDRFVWSLPLGESKVSFLLCFMKIKSCYQLWCWLRRWNILTLNILILLCYYRSITLLRAWKGVKSFIYLGDRNTLSLNWNDNILCFMVFTSPFKLCSNLHYYRSSISNLGFKSRCLFMLSHVKGSISPQRQSWNYHCLSRPGFSHIQDWFKGLCHYCWQETLFLECSFAFQFFS